jgi:hypothetical protein
MVNKVIHFGYIKQMKELNHSLKHYLKPLFQFQNPKHQKENQEQEEQLHQQQNK